MEKKSQSTTFILALAISTTISAHADERADAAKVAFDQLTAETQELYEKLESSFIFDKLSVATTDYQIGDKQSTATLVSEMQLKQPKDKDKDNKTIKTTANYTITYNDELSKQDIVARIKQAEVKYSGHDNQKEMDEMSKSMMGVSVITDIYQNGNIHSHIINKKQGLDLHWRGKLNDLDKVYGTFEGTISDTTDTIDEFSMKELTFKGENNAKDGFIIETTSPLKTEKDGRISSVESMIAKGKLTNIDNLAFSLANASITFKGLETQIEENMTVGFEALTLGFDAQSSSKAGLDVSAHLQVVPRGEWMKVMSQGMLNLSDFNVQLSIDNIPKSIANQLGKITSESIEASYSGDKDSLALKLKDDFEKNAEAWITAVQKLGFGSSIKLQFNSDKGDGFLDLGVHLNDAGYTRKMLEDATPEMLLSLLNINGKSSLPAKLIEDAQLQMFLAMAYKKQEDAYIANVETKDKQLLVNGIPFDLSMLLPQSSASDETAEAIDADEVSTDTAQ